MLTLWAPCEAPKLALWPRRRAILLALVVACITEGCEKTSEFFDPIPYLHSYGLVALAGSNQEGEVGSRLGLPLVTQLVLDDRVLKKANVLVRFLVEGGGGATNPAEVLTNDLGQASTELILGPEQGEQIVRAEIASDPLAGEPARFRAIANRGPAPNELVGTYSGPGTATINQCNLEPTGTFTPTVAIGPGQNQLVWQSNLDVTGTYVPLSGAFNGEASQAVNNFVFVERVSGTFSRVNPPADPKIRFQGNLTIEFRDGSLVLCQSTWGISVTKQ